MCKIIGFIDPGKLPDRKKSPVYRTGYYKENQLVNDYGSGYGTEIIISIDADVKHPFAFSDAREALGVDNIDYSDVWNQTRVYESSLSISDAKKAGWKSFKYIIDWS